MIRDGFFDILHFVADCYTGDEAVFKNNARKFGRNPFFADSAKSFFSHLEDYSKTNGCIPKLTFACHGWGTGLYTDKQGKQDYGHSTGFIFKKTEAGTLDELRKLVSKKKISFCERCLVQIHSCNIEDKFGSTLSSISGCQVVTSAGQCAPVDTVNGSLDHHWISGDDGGSAYSGFVRFTPSGDGTQTLTEHMGRRYIAK